MTMTEILEMLEALGDDVFVDECDEGVEITFDDFEGFDEDWHEVMRDYDHPELVDAFFDMLDEYPCEGDLYVTYHLDGFDVKVGFTSFDI